MGQTWLAADGLTVVDTLSFSYTSDGLLLSASNGFGAYTFSWADGVLTGVINPFGVTLTFGYDGDGRRTSVADSLGGLTTSTYTDGLLSSRMTLAEKPYASGAVILYAVYKYDVFGNRIEKAVDPDGDGPAAAADRNGVMVGVVSDCGGG